MSVLTDVYTLAQVAMHKSKEDCWLVVNSRVLNVTKFLEVHPGGVDALLEVAGKDATKEFHDVGHSKAAELLLANYQVGILQGHIVQEDKLTNAAVAELMHTTEDMPAFVIEEKGWRAALLPFPEFAVPLTATASIVGNSYVTRVAASAS